MNILVVVCHPSKNSYTYQVLEHLKHEIQERKWSFECSDLYAIAFKSDMTAVEYEREGFSRIELPIPPDVAVEHQKIERADAIIFLYPVWWSDCPAKLKGWFDRVFSVGYAYKKSTNLPQMKVLKYGIALCTAGYKNEYMLETGIAQSMENIMLNDRLGNRFENKAMIILGGTLELDSVKEKHREQIRRLVETLGGSLVSG